VIPVALNLWQQTPRGSPAALARRLTIRSTEAPLAGGWLRTDAQIPNLLPPPRALEDMPSTTRHIGLPLSLQRSNLLDPRHPIL
jgi:hypothetical protein